MTTPIELSEKLSYLRTNDPGLKLFGASKHRYSLNPCLSYDALCEFEGSLGIRLPEQFGDFLLRFGNGGAGPGYGLLSLKESIDEFGNDPLERLVRPFIPPRSARERLEDRDYPEDGILPLAHMGCGHMWVLIVTGSDRGTIWRYLSGGDYEPDRFELPDYPLAATLQQRLDANDLLTDALLSDPVRRLSFWDWYTDWLERTARTTPSS
jgi:hypothetical protein